MLRLAGFCVAHAWTRHSCFSFAGYFMDLPDHGLQCTLRSVLLNADTNGLNDILGQEFVGSLLAEEQIVSTEYPAEAETTRGAKQSWGPVLDRPYATSLAAALEHCIREGYFLRPPLPENDGLTSLLVEDGDEIARWQDCVESMRGTEMCSLVSTLSCLGRPGIRLALGQRRTVGSLDVLPPSRHELIQSFSALHKEDTSESCAAAPGPHRCHCPIIIVTSSRGTDYHEIVEVGSVERS